MRTFLLVFLAVAAPSPSPAPAPRPAISASPASTEDPGRRTVSRSRSTTDVAPFAERHRRAGRARRVAIDVRGDTLIVQPQRIVLGRLSGCRPRAGEIDVGTHELSIRLAQWRRARRDRPGQGPELRAVGAGLRRSEDRRMSTSTR